MDPNDLVAFSIARTKKKKREIGEISHAHERRNGVSMIVHEVCRPCSTREIE